MENMLENIGLTKWESQTYLALLELGSTTTGPLVKKAEVPQSKIYAVLSSLNSKGLSTHIIKGKIKYFQASNPKRILDLFKEKEKQIGQIIENLKLKQSQTKQSTELFEGMKSIRSLYLSLLSDVKKGENWYGFGIGIYPNEEIKEFYNWLGPLRANAGVKDHLLTSLEHKKEIEAGVEKESIQSFRRITKYVKIAFPADTSIFRDKIVILNWEETPTAILITSQILANQYKNFFKSLWKLARK